MQFYTVSITQPETNEKQRKSVNLWVFERIYEVFWVLNMIWKDNYVKIRENSGCFCKKLLTIRGESLILYYACITSTT